MFIKESKEKTDPMQFLFTSIGYNAYKHELVKQWPRALISLAPGEMENKE